ncbi:MAG: insulinase family protein [Candidatus Pacebacteria bacterium]|nr:insulinase family protein [Candidatus Paceibacterota bacterium]
MKKTLPNNLRILTLPLENTRVATVFVLVKTGSKYEQKETSGISHFVEHMLFKGTEKRKTPLEVAEELDKVGGVYNAFTGEEYTGYYAKVNVDKFSLALNWVSDIYLNSLLPEKEVEKEKGVIKEEINMYFDNPMAHCELLFQELLYGDQPAGWNIAGTKETVSATTRKDLLTYMESQYKAENTVVVVAGNINKEKVEEEVAQAFSTIKTGTPRKAHPVVENQEGPAVLNFYKETDQTHLILGARAFNMFSEHRYSQEVLASILGGMMSSRLFSKIREEMGLAYYIKTSIDDNPDTGVLYTRAGVENSKTEDAVKAIMNEYKKITEEKVTEKELTKTKEHIKGKTAISLESSDSLAYFHAVNELLENRTYTPEEIFKAIDSVTAEQIQQTAKKIFQPKNLNLVVLGPHKKTTLPSF